MLRKAFPIELISYTDIAPNIRHFCCKRKDNEPFNYIPGQFITLMLEKDDKLLRRSYSLASAPSHDARLEFAASYVPQGAASTFLFNLTPGDEIQTTGPFGRLVLPNETEKRYILIATGTGITPYRAMLTVLAERIVKEGCEVVILQGARNYEDCLYYEEFKQFAEDNPKVTYAVGLSRVTETADRHCQPGYIQHYFDKLNLNPESDLCFLCGNPNMIDDAFAKLMARGFATTRIKREKYISSS